MKKGLTKVIFLIDRSGSMESIKNDVVGGFNSFIEEQKVLPGECHISQYFFANTLEPGALGVDLKTIRPWEAKNFVPRSFTALYDALGQVIDEVGADLKHTAEANRPEKVLFVIITDGEENASYRFSKESVAAKIKHQTEKYNWNFLYLGANQDAWKVGQGMNIINTVTYDATKDGVRRMSASYSAHTQSVRGG